MVVGGGLLLIILLAFLRFAAFTEAEAAHLVTSARLRAVVSQARDSLGEGLLCVRPPSRYGRIAILVLSDEDRASAQHFLERRAVAGSVLVRSEGDFIRAGETLARRIGGERPRSLGDVEVSWTEVFYRGLACPRVRIVLPGARASRAGAWAALAVERYGREFVEVQTIRGVDV
jgi:hypothetical protein